MKPALKLLLITLTVVSVSFGGVVRLVYAASPDSVTKTAIRERTKELRELIEEGQFGQKLEERRTQMAGLEEQAKCNEAYTNLAAFLDLYRANQESLTGDYETLYANINQAITVLESENREEKDLELANLKKLNDGLKDDIFALKSNYFSLIDVLEKDLEIVCDSKYAEINSLKIAIDFLKELRTDTDELQKQAQKLLTEFEELLSSSNE